MVCLPIFPLVKTLATSIAPSAILSAVFIWVYYFLDPSVFCEKKAYFCVFNKIIQKETMNLVVELNIKNAGDWAIIQPLLKRLKIHFVQKNVTPQPITTQPTQLDELYALLDAGVDASYYGDPIAFQRDVRQDATQPFRD